MHGAEWLTLPGVSMWPMCTLTLEVPFGSGFLCTWALEEALWSSPHTGDPWSSLDDMELWTETNKQYSHLPVIKTAASVSVSTLVSSHLYKNSHELLSQGLFSRPGSHGVCWVWSCKDVCSRPSSLCYHCLDLNNLCYLELSCLPHIVRAGHSVLTSSPSLFLLPGKL